MDKNGTMTIDWNEWKKYPTLQPAENIPEIILYWKHSTVSFLQMLQNDLKSSFIHAINMGSWLTCLQGII